MKKTLVAIAALAATAAFAQSAVTLGGEIRFGYQKAPNASATTKADTGFALTDATLKIGVVEDLGGGLKAAANLQLDQNSSAFPGGAAAAAANATTGQSPSTGSMNRRNTSLGLMGGFGTIGLAQTRSSDLITKGMVAPSNLPEGLYNTSGIVARGGIDAIGYTTPNMGGFTANVSLVESNNDGTANPGRSTTVFGADYVNGPLAVGVAFKSTSGKNGFAAPAQKGNTEAYATYDLGVAKLGVGFDSKTNAGAGVTAANALKSAISFGAAMPLGAATVGFNYAKRGTAKVTEAVANYALSKRTSFNVSVGNQGASASTSALVPGSAVAGGAINAKQSQYRISLAHVF